jgi:hypothetical protein
MIDWLSKWAVAIAIAAWLVALAGLWGSGPEWLFDALAILVGGLALVLLFTRGLPRMASKEALGFDSNRSWLFSAVLGRQYPRWSFLLGFVGFVVVVLSGFNTPSGKLAFAGYAMAIAWARANRCYPAERVSG